jgi:putative membrane protein
MLLPTLNALLNGIATILLTIGFVFIRLDRNNRIAHRNCMVGALVVSAFFLFFYVLDKILKGGVHTTFAGEGVWVAVYYFILLTHIPLAMIVLPFIFWTLYLALKNQLERHRRWARVTFPIWYYVSITGVLIYFFLYVWFSPVTTAIVSG